jgi:branched-subunit amino acid transport protein AzlD
MILVVLILGGHALAKKILNMLVVYCFYNVLI